MELLSKIVHDFQPLTTFAKRFFRLRCLTGFWRSLWWLHHLLFLPKNLRSIFFIYTSFLYQHSIDFWINMAGNNAIECKYENVHVFIKYTLQYSYNGVRTIVHEENCPPIRVRVRIRVGRNFPRGAVIIETFYNICYNMKFILPWPQKNWTTQFTTLHKIAQLSTQ